ncbi:protein O-mannosyl-transferase TMTC2-like [Oncorhynchus kisutch]|uniref:protein O-mannosyl-transferase TMTC2-like n=1 Tax=Oncorhynchus kisutch TaxID=8019 RepID=UPI0012DF275F|nr:protein O-mannosyl-transferase TMTC2-like [Oncorhynchus kisutch]
MITELVCSAVALVLYLNTLNADFCYDDSRAIKTNQDLLPETPWTNVLYDDFWGTLLTHSGSHKSFRPLCTLSFRLNLALGGLRPWGYHLVNMGLHGAVTGLFTALCRPLLGGGPWSLLVGLLFASHPVHTEAVAGVVGRADVGAALLFLLSLLCYTRHCGLRSAYTASSRDCQTRGCGRLRAWTWMWLLGSLVCAASSMLWKEQGVTVLAVSAAYDLFVFQRLRFRQAVVVLLGKVNNIALCLQSATPLCVSACIQFPLPPTEGKPQPTTNGSCPSSPMAPQSSSTMAPQSSSPMAPQSSSTMAPQSSSTMVPQSSSPMAPQSSSTMAPQCSSPMAPQSSSPMAPQPSSPMAPQSSSPMAPQSSSSMAPQPSSTMAPQSSSPMALQSSSTMAPQSSSPMAPQSSSPMAPQPAS